MRMEFYVKAFIWLAAGLVLGLAVSLLLAQPAQLGQPAAEPPSGNLSQTGSTPSGSGNATPGGNGSAGSVDGRAAVNITMIDAPDCDACNVGGAMLEQTASLVSNSANLTPGTQLRLNLSSPGAQALVSKYKVTTLPSVIVEGDVGRDSVFVSAWTTNIGTQEGPAALVSRLGYPPFYNVSGGALVGLVDGVGIRASGCLECGDAEIFLTSLEADPVAMAFRNITVYEENDSRAQELISRYNIARLPAILMSQDGVSAYPVYRQIAPMGTEEGGWFVLRQVPPPYIDLAANRTLRGLVNSTLLVNSSCPECFDVASLADYIASNSGMVVAGSQTIEADSAEGIALERKYGLAHVPALIFSSDAQYYYRFSETWKNQTNTIEPDGSFVFRAYGLLGPVYYQNLSVNG